MNQNTVIYARYSSDSQREESIEGQIRECKQYAEKNGLTVLNCYIDRALSAKTDNRPEFQQMIKDSEKGLFDLVLVWKLDRFSRDRYDSAHYKHILKKNGVKVISATENISDRPDGILMESMLEGMAEYYSAELTEKVKRGQTENALKGKMNGGQIPLGYLLGKDKKLEVDPLNAPVIVEIFERYADGETVRTIVEDFNRRNLKTSQNKPFSMGSFTAMLKNRKYIGEYKYRDVVIPDGVPAIVPKDVFQRVQERIEKNKRAPAHMKAKQEFLLSSKLFCGKCGREMVGESGKSHTGTIHYYYKCGNAKRKKGCNKKAIKKDLIERAVVLLTVNRALQDKEINKIADALIRIQKQENTTLPLLQRQLKETEKGLQNMLDAIQQGIFTPSTKQRLNELEVQKEEITVKIAQEQLQKPVFSKEQIIQWIQQFKFGDPNNIDYQKRIIDIFVNSVYLFDDKLVLTYNFKGGTQTIPFNNISSTFGSDLTGCVPPSFATSET